VHTCSGFISLGFTVLEFIGAADVKFEETYRKNYGNPENFGVHAEEPS
jgi:hypothetical protein